MLKGDGQQLWKILQCLVLIRHYSSGLIVWVHKNIQGLTKIIHCPWAHFGTFWVGILKACILVYVCHFWHICLSTGLQVFPAPLQWDTFLLDINMSSTVSNSKAFTPCRSYKLDIVQRVIRKVGSDTESLLPAMASATPFDCFLWLKRICQLEHPGTYPDLYLWSNWKASSWCSLFWGKENKPQEVWLSTFLCWRG